MAVMSLHWLVAASALLPAVSAAGMGSGMGREQPNPPGPVQTARPRLEDAAVGLIPRVVVTARPAPRGLLQKRAANTCGYVDGDSNSQYVCAASNAECIYNTEASAMGCCLATSCQIVTACLPYTKSDAAASMDTARTRYCSNSDLPACAVFSYADASDTLSGFTIQTCDSTSKTYTMFLSTSGKDDPSSSSTSSRSSSDSDTTSTASSDSTASSTGDNDDDDSNRSPAETGAAQQEGTQEESDSAPIGAIVGGVVGAVVAIVLIGFVLLFLRRRKNQNPAPSPSVTTSAPAGGPGFMPPPGQSYYDPNQTPPSAMGAMAYDPRYGSMAKPPGSSSASPVQGSPQMMGHMSMTPSNTPPPQHFHPQMQQQMGAYPYPTGMSGTPPPPGHSPHSQHFAPYPAPPVHMQQQPGYEMAELPATHGNHGPVHEMSGESGRQ